MPEEKARNKTAQNASQRQSSRADTIHEKLEEYVEIQDASVGFVFLWTGRVPVEDAFMQFYGKVVNEDIPPSLLRKIQQILHRVFRYHHPKHKVNKLKGDKDAVDLIERGLDSDIKLDEDNAAAFFKFVEDQKIFGCLKVQDPLKEAWAKFNQRPSNNRGNKENINPQVRTTNCLAVPSSLPAAAPLVALAPSAAPMMSMHMELDSTNIMDATTVNWADNMLSLLEEQNAQPLKKRRAHTDGPRYTAGR